MYKLEIKLMYYEKMLQLYSNNIDFQKVISSIIHEDGNLIIYGNGVLGKTLCTELSIKNRKYVIADKSIKESFVDENGIPNMSLRDVYTSDLPIVITPLMLTDEIVDELLEMGISRKRIFTLGMLIDLVYDMYTKKLSLANLKKGSKFFLITGAQFHNIGAQSMLFVAMNELRERYPDCTVYYLPVGDIDYYTLAICRRYKFNIIKERSFSSAPIKNILTQLDAIIDVSGYILNSNWDIGWYIEILKNADKFSIPLYIMPQSFGPLDFIGKQNDMIARLLEKARVVYAREQYGYDLLTKKFKLTNVKRSVDMVLQNRGVKEKNIYLDMESRESLKLESKHNVGIVPNYRNSIYGDNKRLLDGYKMIISKLIELGKNVYIFQGAEDEELCEEIYNMFLNDGYVHLKLRRYDCIEYSQWIENFDFLIASRFHTIVHAYKKGIPCVILGWAEKYSELAKQMNQEKYVFDVRNNVDFEQMIKCMDYLNEHLEIESMEIKKRLSALQKENCFDNVRV